MPLKDLCKVIQVNYLSKRLMCFFYIYKKSFSSITLYKIISICKQCDYMSLKQGFLKKNTGKIWKDLVRLEYSNIIFDK